MSGGLSRRSELKLARCPHSLTARSFTFYVADPIHSIDSLIRCAPAPAPSPFRVAHLCRGLIRLRPQAHPFGSPHLCRTASRWLHSQLAPFAEIATDLRKTAKE